MVYLLDVNVLLALCDPMHIHHKETHSWFAAKGRNGWATCPLTENGFVRVASHTNYPNRPGDVFAVIEILRQLCETPNHNFWSDEITILDILERGAIVTHTQITDAYLLGLALHHSGRLATLDQRIPLTAVRYGREAIEFLVSRLMVRPRGQRRRGGGRSGG